MYNRTEWYILVMTVMRLHAGQGRGLGPSGFYQVDGLISSCLEPCSLVLHWCQWPGRWYHMMPVRDSDAIRWCPLKPERSQCQWGTAIAYVCWYAPGLEGPGGRSEWRLKIHRWSSSDRRYLGSLPSHLAQPVDPLLVVPVTVVPLKPCGKTTSR